MDRRYPMDGVDWLMAWAVMLGAPAGFCVIGLILQWELTQ